jgi:DNA replication protein DnaC
VTPRPPTKITPDEQLTLLYDALNVLGLGEMRRALDETLAEPAKDDSRLAWLWRLVEPQVRRRVESRSERRIREARLPVRKTFEAFDFAFQPQLDKDLVLELATLRFLAQGKNVLLAGMSGTGKSHIALALGLIACAANRRVLYTTSAEMLAQLTMSLADDTLAQALKPYTRTELLIIDEVGLEQVERDGARRSGLMQKVLLPRYNEQQPTIVTSNIPWEAWGDYLGDHLGATALIDRLLHRSHVLVINGPSYRDWVHKQEAASAQRRAESTPEAATPAPNAPAPAPASPGGARRRGK